MENLRHVDRRRTRRHDREEPADSRRAPLDLPPDEFRRLGHRLVDRVADFLEALPERPVTPGEGPATVRRALGAAQGLPEEGTDPAALLERASELLIDHSLFNGHPRFMGYITAPAAPIGVLGDFLAAAVNPNVAAWSLSPMASEIEAQTVRWIAELIGFPTTGGGLLVSGGNAANLVAFLAARAAAGGEDLRREGVGADAAQGRLRLYASEEAHTWLQKAADASGLGTDSIRWIATDGAQRMDLEALRSAIAADRAAGDRPFLVVGSAGTVSTGAVDPLPDLAGVCRELGLWFHVDGAYGAFAAAVPEAPPELAGMGQADSVAVDPHKWLYAPLEAGCVLVRDGESLRRAFAYKPPYYHFGEEATNYVDLGLQNSRGFRALKVWLGLAQVGRRGYAEMISEDIRLSRELHRLAEAHPEIEPLTQALSITTFRFVPRELRPLVGTAPVEAYLDRVNRELLGRIETGGELFVSNAVVDGRFALRACIVNFRTGPQDVVAVPEIVARLGRELDARLRPHGLEPNPSPE